jgi:hypothetical protein
LNVAVTVVFAVIVTEQAAVPVQAPDHPAKVDPAAGVAVRLTVAPLSKFAEQLVPQLIPEGVLVTVPAPVPAGVTVRVNEAPAVLNVAVTAVFAFIVTVQLAVPVQAPDQPANVDPVPGVAVRVTLEPTENEALQVDPQSIPPGELVTDPLPVPASETLRSGGAAAAVNVAVAEVFAESETTQEPVPEQAPDHPAKVEPAAGAAVSVTVVPLSKFAVQVLPQLIPEGVLVTVPEPSPLACTVSCTEVGPEGEVIDPPPQADNISREARQRETISFWVMGGIPTSIGMLKRTSAKRHFDVDRSRVVVCGNSERNCTT